MLSQQRRQVVFDLQAAAPPPAPVVPRSRAAAAGAIPDPCLDPAALTAGTPQGLIASFSADKSSWACLKLAQSVQQPPAGSRSASCSRCRTSPTRCASALLTNQQFIVVSDPSAFQQYVGAHNELVIANYQFVLDPQQWGRHGTVMLIKNYRKPLAELIADTNTWVLGTRFNVDVAATQQQLTQIANDAYAAYRSGDDDLAAFTAMLTDPDLERHPVPQRLRTAGRLPARARRAGGRHRPGAVPGAPRRRQPDPARRRPDPAGQLAVRPDQLRRRSAAGHQRLRLHGPLRSRSGSRTRPSRRSPAGSPWRSASCSAPR